MMLSLVPPTVSEAGYELPEAPAEADTGVGAGAGTLDCGDSCADEEPGWKTEPVEVHVPSVPHVMPTFWQHAVIGEVQV